VYFCHTFANAGCAIDDNWCMWLISLGFIASFFSNPLEGANEESSYCPLICAGFA
jgi:hypothetical protein